MFSRYFILPIAGVLCSLLPLSAQSVLKGRVFDGADGQVIPYADVIVSDMADIVLSATSTGTDGTFTFERIKPGEVILTVRMLGYEPYVSEKFAIVNDRPIIKDSILMYPSSASLEQATVVGEKSRIVYKLDRQVISGTSSVVADGGTAVDILSSSPSVLIDSEGTLSFRGSTNFLVYVDGRPSPLDGTAALLGIPAAEVEDIDIITTPSARYRTDGDVGIINVTTRKAGKSGLSGLFSLGGSTLGTWSFDGILNYRKNRHNFYAGGTLQQIKGRSDFSQQKNTIVDGTETASSSDGERWSDNGTYTFKAGWQYADGRHHNLAVDILAGKTDNWRAGDMEYDESRRQGGGTLTAFYDSHDRYNLAKHLFQVSVNYDFIPDDNDKFVLQSRFRYDPYSIEYTESNMFDISGVRYEGTRGYEEEHHWDCDGSAVWTHTFNPENKIETGYQYTTYSEHGGYRINYWDRDKEEFIWQDDLAAAFYYRRQLHSVYVMFNGQPGKFGYDAGVRAEHCHDVMDIDIKDAGRDNIRIDVFPSAHLRYDTGKPGIFSIGYSYRTNRPGIWNLEPYITYEDYYTKKIGNPDIRPEYTHSAEIGWRKSMENGSLALTGYYRYRRDISDWVRTAYEPGVTLDIIVNAGDQIENGLEFSGVWKPVKWWNTTLNGSIFKYDFHSDTEYCTDRNGWYGMGVWSNTFSIGQNTRVQVDPHVVGPRILTQGSENGYFFCDIAAREQLFKGRMSVSLVFHDVFRTARYHKVRTAAGLSSTTDIKPKYPNIMLSLTYNFNAAPHKKADITDNTLFEGKDF